MEPLRNFDSYRFSPSQKVQLVSLLVQLLHSHTFEQDQDLDTFIFNYRHKAVLRKQLSQALRTLLKNFFGEINENSLEIHDTLEVLRSFVERLYEQRSDTGIDYPCKEIDKVCSSYTKLSSSKDSNARTLAKIGGPLVILDVLLALDRLADHCADLKKVGFMRKKSYFSLGWLLANIPGCNIHSLLVKDCKGSLIRFLWSSTPFISSTKALLHAHLQTAHIPSSIELLEAIANALFNLLTYTHTPEVRLVVSCEIAVPILRAAMRLSFEHHYNILGYLARAIHLCVIRIVENITQLCSVDGWADFLLSLLERFIEKRTLIKWVKQPHNNDVLILMMINMFVNLIPRRISYDEKRRFLKLASKMKVCRALVNTLSISEVCCMPWHTAKRLIGLLEEDRSFVKKLKKCGMVSTLQKFRSRIEKPHPNVDRGIDRLLKVLDGTA